jgi:iron complex outermembrane receptor protein
MSVSNTAGRIRLSLTMLLATAAMAPTLAAAQTDNAASATALEEIVVTAQRRSENLQTVPVSVTAVTPDTLEKRGVTELADITAVAPSLQIGGDNTFSIRGIGTLAFSNTVDSSVAIAVDGVNLGRPALGGALFNDIAQVEVLNGPQGLLFGKNASAGLLNVTTVRPVLGQVSGRVDAEYDHRKPPSGGADGVITRGVLNIPLGQKAALRLNASYSDQDGLTKINGPQPNGNDNFDRKYGGRAKLLIEPTDDLAVYVIGEYAEEHGVATLFDNTYRSLGAGSINAGPLAADKVVAGPRNFYAGSDGGSFRDLTTKGLQGEVSYSFANGLQLINLAAWKGYDLNQNLDVDHTSSNGANVNRNRAGYDQFSEELRLALPTENRLTGQVGLYYFYSKAKSDAQVAGNNYVPSFVLPNFPFCVGATTLGAPPAACPGSNSYFLGNDHRYSLNTESYAAFGQFTYALSEPLKLIAGARVTRDDLSIDLVQNTGKYFVRLGAPGVYDQDNGNTNVSWKFGAQYQSSPDLMLYGFYGRGYKGPGFNDNGANPLAPLQVRPETNNALELGVKSSWFDRRLVLNASAFHQKFKDYQTQAFDPVLASFIVQNAAELKSQGVELTAMARPVRGLTLDLNATVLDSKFGDFPGAQCYQGQTTPSCATTGAFNAAGSTTPVSPKFTGTAQITYEWALASDISAFVSGNLYHRSSVNYSASQAPGTALGAIDILGLNAGAQFPSGFKASVFCRNCTNKIYPASIGADTGDAFNGVASYTQRFDYNSVRTVGVQASYAF